MLAMDDLQGARAAIRQESKSANWRAVSMDFPSQPLTRSTSLPILETASPTLVSTSDALMGEGASSYA